MSEKKFLFYNPGMKGTVFNLASKDYITPELVKHTKDHLEYEIEHSVAIQKKEGLNPGQKNPGIQR